MKVEKGGKAAKSDRGDKTSEEGSRGEAVESVEGGRSRGSLSLTAPGLTTQRLSLAPAMKSYSTADVARLIGLTPRAGAGVCAGRAFCIQPAARVIPTGSRFRIWCSCAPPRR